MIDWSDAEDALRAWVVTASGLANSHVLWAQQGTPRPADGVFIALTLDGPRAIGVDAHSCTTDLGQAAGSEVLLAVTGPREVTLRLSCYEGNATGDASARAVLAGVAAKVNLPSIRSALWAAGIGLVDMGDVQNVGAILAVGFEARAVLEARFTLRETVSERVGYIATATTDGTLTH